MTKQQREAIQLIKRDMRLSRITAYSLAKEIRRNASSIYGLLFVTGGKFKWNEQLVRRIFTYFGRTLPRKRIGGKYTMPERTHGATTRKRNARIVRQVHYGISQSEIAREHGISRQRVSQIYHLYK